MTVWWSALILLCCILNCVETSAPSPVQKEYSNSFLLTSHTRNRVKTLLREYKKHQLENVDFEDKGRQLKDLPLLSTDFYSWLQLTVSVCLGVSKEILQEVTVWCLLCAKDWERLHTALWDMQSFWNVLELKRKQLEKEKEERMPASTSIPRSIKHVQLDLRDLMNKVSSQMSKMKRSWVKPTSLTVRTHLNPEANSKTVWDSRVEGYIILRDLDLYLTKLARDFLLLASRTRI
ncbi:uncharacterized protein LOC122995785 [Thunnus albacares]|uniref:uncharacterized protein LOC122995785 n=1 Tax=Thunnus albacares TaxID=8236 RepID=UPI001CF70564|nr:uncharacterized protein LOC122995785 [Thunnus albacares]